MSYCLRRLRELGLFWTSSRSIQLREMETGARYSFRRRLDSLQVRVIGVLIVIEVT